MTACVGSTLLFHPAIVPSSVANNSVLGPDLPPDEMTKPGVALVATPVGAEVPVPPGTGMDTSTGEPDGRAWPVASSDSAVRLPFSATDSPLLVPRAMPQGFARVGYVLWARPGPSDTGFVWVKVTAGTRRPSSSSHRRRAEWRGEIRLRLEEMLPMVIVSGWVAGMCWHAVRTGFRLARAGRSPAPSTSRGCG